MFDRQCTVYCFDRNKWTVVVDCIEVSDISIRMTCIIFLLFRRICLFVSLSSFGNTPLCQKYVTWLSILLRQVLNTRGSKSYKCHSVLVQQPCQATALYAAHAWYCFSLCNSVLFCLLALLQGFIFVRCLVCHCDHFLMSYLIIY